MSVIWCMMRSSLASISGFVVRPLMLTSIVTAASMKASNASRKSGDIRRTACGAVCSQKVDKSFS